MSTEDKKISDLYKQDNNQQPPTHLDNVIINAAKEAVSTAPQLSNSDNKNQSTTTKGPFSGGWTATVSIAAVIIISVTLVPLINKETPPQTTASSDFNNKKEQLREEDNLDRELTEQLDTMETKQRSASKQKKNMNDNRHLLQAPAMSSGKGQTIQDALAPTTMKSIELKKEIYPARKEQSAKEKNNRYNYLMSISEEEKAATAADSIFTQNNSEILNNLMPQEWLKNIQTLINQGNIKVAKKELEAFKESHPDVIVWQSILNGLDETPN